MIIKEKNIKAELKSEQIAEQIEEKYKNKLQFHFFEEKEFKEAKSQLIKEIKKDSIEIF